jgi:endonuclease/exonuclease/phosphatase (EEP) superfamily protein YafD
MKALVPRIDSVVGPQLVMGDLNQTEWSSSYPLVATELGDSFREAGWGFGHTFPSDLAWTHLDISLPLLRIDYVFHSSDLLVEEAHVGPAGGSHHLPVSVALGFR